MSYFIFVKDLNNVEGTIYRIAENQDDLNNLNITQSIYKITPMVNLTIGAITLLFKYIYLLLNDNFNSLSISIHD
jgi:hypothetical protein